jgi:hypothetical protein
VAIQFDLTGDADNATILIEPQASTEDLRQAMIHYRTLLEELVNEPEIARAKGA